MALSGVLVPLILPSASYLTEITWRGYPLGVRGRGCPGGRQVRLEPQAPSERLRACESQLRWGMAPPQEPDNLVLFAQLSLRVAALWL